MTEKNAKTRSGGAAEARKARLGKSLKQNMQKRKAQANARRAEDRKDEDRA